MTVDEIVDEVERKLDDRGQWLTKTEWIDLCERIATNCEMKAEATREELEDEQQ